MFTMFGPMPHNCLFCGSVLMFLYFNSKDKSPRPHIYSCLAGTQYCSNINHRFFREKLFDLSHITIFG